MLRQVSVLQVGLSKTKPGRPATLSQRVVTRSGLSNAAAVAGARAVTMAAAEGLWRELVSLHGSDVVRLPIHDKPDIDLELPEDLALEAARFGRSLATLSVESSTAELGKLYTSSLPASLRATGGVFYTPPTLVARVVDRASLNGLDWARCRVISPACGCGQFLVEDARRMMTAMGPCESSLIVASVAARLRGWDIDAFATWLAQVSVEMVLIDHVIRSGRRLPRITEERDSLLSDWSNHEGTYDLVNENPAFGKVKDTPAFRSKFARSLHGHPNLYGMFTELAVRLAKPRGGVVALLTPTSYFGGHYFKELRSFLHEAARPVAIDIVESRRDVFPDVLQEVALSILVKGRRSAQAECSIVRIGKIGLDVEKVGKLQLGRDPRAPWLIPRRKSDIALTKAMHRLDGRLSTWGYCVSTGPLVWNRAAKAGRLHDGAAKGRYPIIWAEAVNSEGRFALKSTRREHLSHYESSFLEDPSRDPNLVTTGCLLLQRTTAKEQKKRFIGALMPASFVKAHGAVVVENHLNMIRPCMARPPVPIEAVAAFFASSMADRVIRCISGSVALSAAEIGAMPLPAAADLARAFKSHDFESALADLYGPADHG